MNDDEDEPHCGECGSEDLEDLYRCASHHVYRCRDCGEDVYWPLSDEEEEE